MIDWLLFLSQLSPSLTAIYLLFPILIIVLSTGANYKRDPAQPGVTRRQSATAAEVTRGCPAHENCATTITGNYVLYALTLKFHFRLYSA